MGAQRPCSKFAKYLRKNAVIDAPMAPVPQELHMPVSDQHCQDYRRHHDYRRSHLGKGDSYHEKFTDQVYRAIIWDLEQRILSDVMQRHFSAPGHVRLLDFACGTGRILGLLENRVATSTGVDVAPSMMEVAARNLGRSRLLCSDITRESTLDGERFDLITAFRFFPNAEIELRHEAMAKLIELLAPGGRLIFNNHLRSGSARHRRLMAKDRRGRLKNKRALHSMDDEEVLGLAADHGLTMLEEHHLGLLPVLRDRKPLRWHPLALPIERLAARMKLLAPLAGHKIYVLSNGKVPC